MLTRKQLALLTFLAERAEQSPVSPSYEEMKEALGFKAKSGVHRLIWALERRGFISIRPKQARSIIVLRGPEGQNLGALEAENARLREEVRRLRAELGILERQVAHYRYMATRRNAREAVNA